jgi:hypothetical protein
LFRGFSTIWQSYFVQCVLASISPVAVRLQYVRGRGELRRLRLCSPTAHAAWCLVMEASPKRRSSVGAACGVDEPRSARLHFSGADLNALGHPLRAVDIRPAAVPSSLDSCLFADVNISS